MPDLTLSSLPPVPAVDEALELYTNDSGSSGMLTVGDLQDYLAGLFGFSGTSFDILTLTEIAAPALSDSGSGRIYFDETTNTFLVSEDGGAYTSLGQLKVDGTSLYTPGQGATLGGTAADALAVGTNASADSTDSIAIGNGAQATAASAIAVGEGITVSTAAALSVGANGNAVIRGFDITVAANCVVDINAGLRLKSAKTAANAVIDRGATIIEQTLGKITTSLYANPTLDDVVFIKNNSGDMTTVDGNGETIEGATFQMLSNGSSVTLWYNGTEWLVI